MHSATIFFALTAVVASASAVGVVHDVYAYPAYKYSYGVADKVTGDQKSAAEVRDGDVTRGSYSLVQPDGVVRTVNYISTPKGGFQAQVTNKGVAGHPAVIGVGKGIGAIGVVSAPGLAVGGLNYGLGAISAHGLAVGGHNLGHGARSVVGRHDLVAPLGLGAGVGLGGLGLSGLGGVGIVG